MSPSVTVPRETQTIEQRFDKPAATAAPAEPPQPDPAPFAPAWNPEFAPLR